MMKHIAAFVGSARKHGYCEALISELRRGAESLGAEVTVFHVTDMTIKPCLGCMYCRQEKGCVIQNDDMMEVYRALRDADGVAFSSPIYFGQMAGACLTLLDRLYPLVSADRTPALGRKPAVLIYTQAVPGPETYKQYIDLSAHRFWCLGLDIQETIICDDTRTARADQAVRPDMLERAYAAGRQLAE